MMGKMFGLERDEGRGEWRRLHTEKHRDLYSTPNFYSGNSMKEDAVGGTCSTYGEERCIQSFGGKT